MSSPRNTVALLAILGTTTFGAPPQADADCGGGTFTKAHTWSDADADGRLSDADVLSYTIVFCQPGSGNGSCGFVDLLPADLRLDPASIRCTPDVPGNTPDFCGENPPGFGRILVDYSSSRLEKSACVTVTFDASVVGAPTTRVCNQAENVFVPAHVSDLDCQEVEPDYELSVTKTALSPVVAVDGTVDFEITVRNVGTVPMSDGDLNDWFDGCFLPLGADGADCDPAVVRCDGAGCAGATCAYELGGMGFNFRDFALVPDDGAAGGDDELRLTVTMGAGPVPGACSNWVETFDSGSTLEDSATVEIQALPDLALELEAVWPTVMVGDAAEFVIRLQNVGVAPLNAGRVEHRLQSCFVRLGPDDDDCDPSVVRCDGPGCAGTLCTYRSGGLGFRLTELDLAANDGADGGPDEVVITVSPQTGTVPGFCRGEAETSDPDTPTLIAGDEVEIIGAAPSCDLMMDDVTFPPVTPPLGSLYSVDCGAGHPRLGRVHTTDIVDGDLADDYGDAAGSLRLYQLGCGCSGGVRLTKNPLTGRVAITLP